MSVKYDPWLNRILTGKILREGILLLAGLFFFAHAVQSQPRVGQEARTLIDAYHALWQSQPGEAVLALEGLLADHPEDPALLMTMAEALLALGQANQAQTYADRAVELRATDPDLGLAAYRIAVNRNDDSGAIARLETLFARFPTHPEIGMLFAEQFFRDGETDHARQIWMQIRHSSALWGPQASRRLRDTAPRVAREREVSSDFSLEGARRYLNQHPDQPEAYLRVAFAAWAESPTSREADDALEDAALIFGDHPVTQLGAIWRTLQAGSYAEAQALLTGADVTEGYAEAFAFARAALNRLRGTPEPSDDLRDGVVLAARGLAPPPEAPISIRLQGP